ncbi:MAG: 50S ribosomal protein L5 [Candidatus Micrarchaeia archaeon]
MREIKIDKVVVNIGIGKAGEPLENTASFLEKLAGKKPVITKARSRNPTWNLRKGLPIGVKVTFRGAEAEEFLRKAFEAVGNKISKNSFDGRGNFSFGVAEYIDFPGVKYDPKVGMLGFDVCVSLKRPGYRVMRRRVARSKIGKRHIITNEEAQKFVSDKYGVNLFGRWEGE